ncbi:MAG: universal stress protein [Chromatiales bacterium]|nr:universal stress protein [Gammaproteobacteria bacterium]MCP5352661.1 universal stress protein [Chromatiales bacterium]
MKRFQNILFLADSYPVSPRGLERAIELAARNHARLTLLAVAEPIDSSDPALAAPGQSLNNALQVGLLSGLDEALAQFDPEQRSNLQIQTRAALGVPYLLAIRAIAEHGHDLVMKAAERPNGTVRRLFGSTDMHLLRKAPCPVWIEPDAALPRHRRLIAAIDPLSEAGDGLDRKILELATSLALIEGADLDVIHVWRLPGEQFLSRGRARISETELQHLLRATEARHRAAVDHAVEPFRAMPIVLRVHFVKGLPGEAIQALAQRRDADLIVMGTVGRTGIPGFFIGNTAEQVLGDAPCGVLAVKPEGFRSPVLAT